MAVSLFGVATAMSVRGKFLAMLSDLLANGALKLPPDCSAERLQSLINRLGRVKWHVWLCERYEHGLGVITYLARYLRGGPLCDSQLVSVDDERIVTSYQPHDSNDHGKNSTPDNETCHDHSLTPVPPLPMGEGYGSSLREFHVNHPALLTLAPEVWLQRYLEHAPISGQHSIRHYGLYAPASGDETPTRLRTGSPAKSPRSPT